MNITIIIFYSYVSPFLIILCPLHSFLSELSSLGSSLYLNSQSTLVFTMGPLPRWYPLLHGLSHGMDFFSNHHLMKTHGRIGALWALWVCLKGIAYPLGKVSVFVPQTGSPKPGALCYFLVHCCLFLCIFSHSITASVNFQSFSFSFSLKQSLSHADFS